MLKNTYPFELPQLPYPYNALEPYIDEETMHYHYDKHFKGYIDKLNAALEPYPSLHFLSLERLIRTPRLVPYAARESVLNNGGGVYNHYMYFNGLAPVTQGAHEPQGKLLGLMEQDWGSFEGFKKAFNAKAMEVFGSGWTVLLWFPGAGLQIANLPNQQTALRGNALPLLHMDIWEHAYYLKYKNLRLDYIENIWNIISFPQDM